MQNLMMLAENTAVNKISSAPPPCTHHHKIAFFAIKVLVASLLYTHKHTHTQNDVHILCFPSLSKSDGRLCDLDKPKI
jgi:hypothetical protein